MKKLWLLSLVIITAPTYNKTDNEEMMKQYYQHKKVLVTGGCGFIGSHLVETLVRYGAQVTILDDLSSGSLENIASCAESVTFINGSITDKKICQKAVDGKSHVFHLAAFISVPQSIEEPSNCHFINVDGTFNMLDAARHARVERFIFSSSSAVYGTQQNRCSEQTSCNPLSPYAFSKLIGEELCWQFAKNYGLETAMLRYFNVFGPRQNPNGQYAAVVAKFTDSIIRNQPITIFGDGSQTRDFVPVSQVVQTNLLVGMLPKEAIKERVFNVATGKSINLLELLEQLKKEYPSYDLAPQFLPARPGDSKESYADCTRLMALKECFLGF